MMEPSNWLTALSIFLATETTIIGFIWGFAWWLSKRFNGIYSKIQTTLDLMISKLEYHEQHDDKRFSELNNGLWMLRLENARLAKTPLPLDEKPSVI